MQAILTSIVPLVARLLLAAIFLWSGYGKIGGFDATLKGMINHGIPLAQVALLITIALELIAAALIAAGWKTRGAAFLLVLWMIPVTLIYHKFWAVPEARVFIERIMFLKNLGIMGGLLMLVAYGPGRLSLDRH